MKSINDKTPLIIIILYKNYLMQKLGNLLMFEPDVILCGSKKMPFLFFYFFSLLNFRFHRTVSLLDRCNCKYPTLVYYRPFDLVLDLELLVYLSIIMALQLLMSISNPLKVINFCNHNINLFLMLILKLMLICCHLDKVDVSNSGQRHQL